MANGFEGWYFKHQKGPETLSIIAGRAQDGAFIQAITPAGSYRAVYPPAAYHKKNRLWLSGSRFGADGIALSVHDRDLELTGRLRYSHLTPVDGDLMGPFRFFPMQCRHTVVSMNHALEGSVFLNGKELDFTGGKGYIEGDFGRSFPQSYTWVQCGAFDCDCSIMASAAHVPFAGSWFWGCVCVVWLKGAEHRLATYRGAVIRRRDERQLLITQKDCSLHIVFLQPQAWYALDAPSRGRMSRTIREVPSAPAYFEFRQGGQVLFRGESPFASYEVVL